MDDWTSLSAHDKSHKHFLTAKHGHTNNFSKGHHHPLPAHAEEAAAEAAEDLLNHPQLPHHIHHKLVHPGGTALGDHDLLKLLYLLAREHRLHTKHEALHLLTHIRHHLDHAKPHLPEHRRKKSSHKGVQAGPAGHDPKGRGRHRRHKLGLHGVKHHLIGY
jgi:hypothetical protein